MTDAARRVAVRKLQADADHRKSVALMKFLSGVARKEGVAKHVYVVGGAVRNYLLGVPIKDIDVVVDSVELGRGRDSEWFAKQVADAIPVPSSLVTNQYGVAILTVKGPWELEGLDLQGEVIEIANARKESYEGAGGKGKGYKPTDVAPATIKEDVFRREFTFNTLLWRLLDLVDGPDKAEVIDLTGLGRSHLEEKLISTPVDPDKTFSDDPTRQLRILKFLLRYGLKISPDVVASVKRNAPKLKQMPWEAVANILVKDILDSPRASEGLRVMRSLGMLDVLAEMVAETPSFAAYLNRQLASGNRPVALLLELADVGLSDKAMEFLTPAQKSSFKAVAASLDPEEARKLLDALKRPPADNAAIIQEFALEGRDRGMLVTVARDVLIEDPSTLKNPVELNDRIRDRLRAWLPARVASRFLVAENVTEIDPSLVTGLRAWVKQTFAPKSHYESVSDLIDHVRTLHDKDLNRFWEYLFYNKGLLPRGAGFDSVIEKMRVKVGKELKVARDVLGFLLERMQDVFDMMTPGTTRYELDQGRGNASALSFYQEIDPNDPFGAALRGFVGEAKEKIEAVEALLSGKVLRAISAFLNKYADDQPFESDEILLEYDIGRVKLVYDGEPNRHLINRPESANPRRLSDYIPYFMKAKALLDRRGFSDLWYGPMFVGCPKCGGENPLGKKFGVGAHYMTGRDEITVFLEPQRYLVDLLIHELGHRYYFKFMDQGDRARFDSFYKEVAAVSEYGGTTTEEDFAEVFSHFVLGRDMTRDQIERFKAFLAKKDRGRFAGFATASRYLAAAGKYDDIDFKPPASVADAAKKGLDYREKASPSNKGGLTPAEAGEQGIGSGVQRAVNLKNRDNATPETISKMVGFFARSEKNKGVSPENRGEPWNDKGHVAWLLWGGDPGKSWAEKVKAQMDKADEQSKTASLRVAARFMKAVGWQKRRELELEQLLEIRQERNQKIRNQMLDEQEERLQRDWNALTDKEKVEAVAEINRHKDKVKEWREIDAKWHDWYNDESGKRDKAVKNFLKQLASEMSREGWEPNGEPKINSVNRWDVTYTYSKPAKGAPKSILGDPLYYVGYVRATWTRNIDEIDNPKPAVEIEARGDVRIKYKNGFSFGNPEEIFLKDKHLKVQNVSSVEELKETVDKLVDEGQALVLGALRVEETGIPLPPKDPAPLKNQKPIPHPPKTWDWQKKLEKRLEGGAEPKPSAPSPGTSTPVGEQGEILDKVRRLGEAAAAANNQWMSDFSKSIAAQLAAGRALSEKQQAVLERGFKQFRVAAGNVAAGNVADLEDACWEGYEAVGMKEKGGKLVPNCVPVKTASPARVAARFLSR